MAAMTLLARDLDGTFWLVTDTSAEGMTAARRGEFYTVADHAYPIEVKKKNPALRTFGRLEDSIRRCALAAQFPSCLLDSMGIQ